ncbi:hypothetical protein ABVK25_009269 [Lepraria finkii]|uniref:Uncharacterized protein n=1 Tax=Lepraria finkii TaxID=1340010 RepID=A0ABR4AXQ2_9LECA
MYRCLVQMKEKITFTLPGRVVIRASTELAIPDIAAARCEGGVFGIRVSVAKIFTEGLGCDAGRDEIDLIVAVGVRVLMLSPFIRRTFRGCFRKELEYNVPFPSRRG